MTLSNSNAHRFLAVLLGLALAACEGPAGPGGATGASGVDGAIGRDGIPGSRGADGDTGEPGADGDDGAPGQPGADGGSGGAGPQGPPGPPVAPAYLTGPGIVLQLTGAEITADERISVSYSITDGAGLPLDRDGLVTEGRFAPSFVLARFDPAADRYVSLVTRTESSAAGDATQAAAESSGTTTTVAVGSYRYDSNVVLPAGLDPDTTFRVGVYGSRSFQGDAHVANAILDFTRSGAAVAGRELVASESCGSCHGALKLHGGSRRDPRLCVECHSPQSSDSETGNSLDFPVLIHRIHMGVDLPSVAGGPVGAQYAISGYQDHLYVYAERFGPEAGDVAGTLYPHDQRLCSSCHAAAAQGGRFETTLTIAACTTCHDTTSFVSPAPAGFTLHSAGVRPEAECATCHGVGAAVSVALSHRGDEAFVGDEGLLLGLQLSIERVEAVSPGSSPSITFRLTDAAGAPVLPSSLGRITATLAGPLSNPTWTIPGLTLAGATDNGDGTFTALLATPLPADLDPADAIVVGLEARRTVSVDRWGTLVTFNEAVFNPLAYVNADGTDSSAAAPEPAVALERCNSCHEKLALHGSLRQNVQYCGSCHTPTATDSAVRPAGEGAPETIDFRVLVHKIHRGEELTSPYVVYGFGGRRYDFGETRFPGDLRRCESCHVSESWQQPNTAACTSCHDSAAAEAHAELNTTASGVESCEVCHGAGREFAVDAVHVPGL